MSIKQIDNIEYTHIYNLECTEDSITYNTDGCKALVTFKDIPTDVREDFLKLFTYGRHYNFDIIYYLTDKN